MVMSSDPDYVVIGRVLAPWGNAGKVKVQVITDFPQRFCAGATVYIARQPATISEVSAQKGQLILKLESVDSIEAARKLHNCNIEIPESQLQKLPEGQYYCFQLAGLEVRTRAGAVVGKVLDVLSGGPNDIYVVGGKSGEILIPAVADVVKSIDIPGKIMIIEAVPGLLDLNEKTTGRE